MEVRMANECGFYRKKNSNCMNGNPEPDYPVNAHQAPDDSGLPDYTGKPMQTARNTPHAGRQDTFSVRFGQGMNAVADMIPSHRPSRTNTTRTTPYPRVSFRG